MITTTEEARAYVASLGGLDAVDKLQQFAADLAEENARQNLVSRRSIEDVWVRHIADSAQLVRFVPRETGSWLDLGTGAGFPGLVAAVLLPDMKVELMEARPLRVAWLEQQISKLNLKNCVVLQGDVAKAQHRDADVISARAFAPLPRLLKLASRFSTPSSVWLLPKGRTAAQEVGDLPPRVARMFHVEQSLTDTEAGIIVGKGMPELAK